MPKRPLKWNVLDIGTGSMWFIKYWNNQNDKYFVGIDPMIRKSAFRVIKRYGRSYLIEGVGESLPLKSNVFDEVTINSTLDHIENPEKVLSESFRTLKKRGRLRIITIISHQSKPISPHIGDIKKPILMKILKENFRIEDEIWMDQKKRFST